MDETVGIKDDYTKCRLELISPLAISMMAAVLTEGAVKYSDNNWRNGIKFSRLIGAILRHTIALLAGIDHDKETKQHHAAHIMCEAMFLIELSYTRTDLDDRFKYGDKFKDLLESLLADVKSNKI